MGLLRAEVSDPATWVFAATALTGAAGVPGLALTGRPGLGQRISVWTTLLAAIMGLAGSIALLSAGGTAVFAIDWTLPFGPAEIAIDPLSALFLLPIFLVAGCAALYAGAYWPAAENRRTEPILTCAVGLLAAAMAVVVMARSGVLFLMAWEVMALAAFFAFTVENERLDVRKAGMVYLVATHTGTIFLFVMFALLRGGTGSFLFPAGGSLASTAPLATAIFLTAFVGFGFKAGLMPFHVWLPAAHASGPSHVSAMMSGVMLNMGLYGLFRIVSLFAAPPLWWGVLVLVVGGISALLGIVSAIGENDLKRLLAYSSIENIGIVAIGLGTALIGLASHRPLLGLLGLAGALLHTLNHSLFKPLLFFGAGAVIHSTGTRRTDLMGGLARNMPITAALSLIGMVAICGLPPLNGFAGEFLLYGAFFTDALCSKIPYLALAAPLLALIGGLAALCFTKVFGVVFLGLPRSDGGHGHEPDLRMLAPMGLLALLCLLFGVVPQLPLALLQPAATAVAPELAAAAAGISAVAPFRWLTIGGAGLLVLVALLALILRSRIGSAEVGVSRTWGCGYLKPKGWMQYTASSFSEMMVRLFTPALRPQFVMPAIRELFPEGSAFMGRCPEILLERLVMPLFRGIEIVFAFCRHLQHGEHHLYVLYIFGTLFILMVLGR